jgi:hypothetical protein
MLDNFCNLAVDAQNPGPGEDECYGDFATMTLNQSYNPNRPTASRDATSCRKRSLDLRSFCVLTLNFCGKVWMPNIALLKR